MTSTRPAAMGAQRKPSPNIAWVNEPRVPECRASEQWRLRLLRSHMTGKCEIEIVFFTRDGQGRTLRVDLGRRSDFEWVRRELDSQNARLPDDKGQSVAFVQDLLRKTPSKPVVACAAPTWNKDATGFVMPYKCYGSAYATWDWKHAERGFAKMVGELETYQSTILRAAKASPFVSLAVMIALAGPLLGYVARRGRGHLLTENAIFHFAGVTSTGKSTLASIAQSVFGSPTIARDYDASERGIAEAAYFRNNLCLTLDEAEVGGDSDRETLNKIVKFAHIFTRGRTRTVATKSTRSDLPALRWSCHAISSGPDTVAALFTRPTGRERKGERARILDIQLPSPEEGGIFGSPETADGMEPGDSAGRINQLEEWLPQAHGVLFDAWIEYLLEYDVADRIIELFKEFVAAMAEGALGLEQRIAKKYAIVYAAGRVGVESGLLPWPREWPFRAVRACYENSLTQLDPDGVAAAKAVRRLAQSLRDPRLLPRFLAQRGRYPEWNEEQVGLRVKREGALETLISKERLGLVDDASGLDQQIFDLLVRLKIVRADRAGSRSRQERVWSNGEMTKVRLWQLNAERLEEWANASAPDRAAERHPIRRVTKTSETLKPRSTQTPASGRTTEAVRTQRSPNKSEARSRRPASPSKSRLRDSAKRR